MHMFLNKLKFLVKNNSECMIMIKINSTFISKTYNMSGSWKKENTLKCLSIGTPTSPLFPDRKWWLLGVPIFEHIIISL